MGKENFQNFLDFRFFKKIDETRNFLFEEIKYD